MSLVLRTRPLLRLLALSGLLLTGTVHADVYGDVSSLAKSGKTAEAIAKADQYLGSNPRDPQMRFLKGVALADAGRSADAIAVYTALTQEYPELPEPHNNLAVLHAGQNQLDKARAALETALRINPGYATAHENLGDVYARLAGQSYARAQQLEPQLASSVAPKLALVRQLTDSARPAPRPAARPASR